MDSKKPSTAGKKKTPVSQKAKSAIVSAVMKSHCKKG